MQIIERFINKFPEYNTEYAINTLKDLKHRLDIDQYFYMEQFLEERLISPNSYMAKGCDHFVNYITSQDEPSFNYNINMFLEPIENYQFGNGIQKSPTTGKWRWWKLTCEPFLLVPDFEVSKMGPIREVKSEDAFIELKETKKLTETLQEYPFLIHDLREHNATIGRIVQGIQQENVTTLWTCPCCNIANQSLLSTLRSGQLACYNCNQMVMLP